MEKIKKQSKITALLLTFVLCFQLLVPAFAKPAFAAPSGNEYFSMTTSSFTIDGVTITKAELLGALKDAKRMPNDWAARAPRLAASLEYTHSPAFDPKAQSALATIGLGVAGVFQKIAYTLMLTGIAGTTWYITVNGLDLLVTVTGSGFVINGVSLDYNWLTYELARYFDGHMEDWFDFSETENEGGSEADLPENTTDAGKKGSKAWNDAKNKIKNGKGKGINTKTDSQEAAEQLINEARPELEKKPTYSGDGKSGYEIHPAEPNVGNNKPHIKWWDWSNGKANGAEGHIYFD